MALTTTSTPEVDGLFLEPDHANLWTGFPLALVKDTTLNDGLRYTGVGEDGDTLVFLGHPDTGRVVDVARAHCDVDTEYSDPDELIYTWARLLTHCPDHLANHSNDCRWCVGITFDSGWWLDWSVPEDAKRDVNAGKPGYFPVTVWELDQ